MITRVWPVNVRVLIPRAYQLFSSFSLFENGPLFGPHDEAVGIAVEADVGVELLALVGEVVVVGPVVSR